MTPKLFLDLLSLKNSVLKRRGENDNYKFNVLKLKRTLKVIQKKKAQSIFGPLSRL